jgi:ribose ABC transporter membrane protein
LDAIACVVLGGTNLFGGRGSLIGTMIGVLIIGVITNGLNLLGVSSFIQQIIKGVILLLAILFSKRK